MRCLKCNAEGAYFRFKVVNGKKTKDKEVYCRFCGEASDVKKESEK